MTMKDHEFEGEFENFISPQYYTTGLFNTKYSY